MFTLNIYTPEFPHQYLCSISQNTRKECMAIANKKYANHAWDWDDKNYVKNKKFSRDESTTVSVNLSNLIS